MRGKESLAFTTSCNGGETDDYLPLVLGSITKRVFGDGRIERCENVKDVVQYIERIDEMIERKRKLFAENEKTG